jgi:WD40 repeat protein
MYPTLYRRYLIILFLLAGSFRLPGQPVGASKKQNAGKPPKPSGQQRLSGVEKQAFWVKKGDALMGKEQNYTAAYSAYLLAKSLGAPGMSDKMQLAQQKNIEKLRANSARLTFQAGLQQAKNLAETDLTQSLRLLEFLQHTYAGERSTQNETAVLRAISEVTANTGQAIYKAKRTRLVEPTDYITQKDTSQSDTLSRQLQQIVDTLFSQLPVPAYKPVPIFQFPPLVGKKQQRGYYYSAANHLLFTFYAYLYHEADSEVPLDSAFSTTLWRINGTRPIALHTFSSKFDRPPRLSSDGQLLAVQLQGNRLTGGASERDSIFLITNTKLLVVKGGPDENFPGPFMWFSPDSRYVVTRSSASTGMAVIWRKTTNDLYYRLSVDAYPQSVQFEEETVRLNLFDLTAIDTLYVTELTIDLKTQQAILPAPYLYPERATNVFFADDNYLMVQHTGYPPHIVLYSLTGEWPERSEQTFSGLFSGGGIAPNGQYAVLHSLNADQSSSLWITDKTGHFRKKGAWATGFRNAVFSSDNQLALLSYGETSPGQLVRLDSLDFRVIHTFTQPVSATGCQFSPDGRWLFTDFANSDQDSLWQITATVLLPVREILAIGGPTAIRFQPSSEEMLSFTMDNVLEYLKLEPGAVDTKAFYNDVLPAVNTLYINGDQIFYSETDTYIADRNKKEGFRLASTKLSNGALISPVFDDGETLFFVVYADLSRRQTLVGYDKKLRQPVLSRAVNGAFDLRMTTDKTIRLADVTGLYTIVPPRKILRLLQTNAVATLTDKLREQFSPPKP